MNKAQTESLMNYQCEVAAKALELAIMESGYLSSAKAVKESTTLGQAFSYFLHKAELIVKSK